MAYTKQTWSNNPSTATPLSAERLTYLETQYDEAVAAVPGLIAADPNFSTNATAAVDAAITAEGGVVDATVTALDANPASAYRVQADARQNATFARGVSVKDPRFGATGDGVTDDTVAIQAAIDATSILGGTVYFPTGAYRITSTLTVSQASVSLVGDGQGNGDTRASAATVIIYDGTAGGTLLSLFKARGSSIEGILLDGNSKAAIGLYADRLRSARVSGLTVRSCTTVGIFLTTTATTANDNTMFNNFTEVNVSACPIGVQVDGDTVNLSNSCHNTFTGLRLSYTGSYGLLLGNADNNTFVDVATFRTSGSGYGVGFVGDSLAANGALARSNYLYHVQGIVFARAGSYANMIFGYDQENAQGDPVVEVGAELSWMGNAGAVQQKYWSIAQPIKAPNIVQKNAFVNGNFDVWTYGTTFTDPAANASFAPRWRFWFNSTLPCTVSRESFAPGQSEVPHNPRYFTKISIPAGGASTAAAIAFKTENVNKFNGEYVRVSMYLKGSVARTLDFNLKQEFGTGGSPSATVSTVVSSPILTTSWVKHSFLVLLPSTAGKTLGTNPNTDALTLEATFNPSTAVDVMLSQLKLERGIVGTPSVLREPQEEEALCSRFAQSLTAQIGATDTVLAFPGMAFNPTVTGGGTGFAITAVAPNYIRATQTTASLRTLLLKAE